MIFVQINYTESLVLKISKYTNFEQIKRLKLKEETKNILYINIILFFLTCNVLQVNILNNFMIRRKRKIKWQYFFVSS